MKRKNYLVTLLCLLLVIASACSSTADGEEKKSSSDKDNKTLMLAGYGGSYEQKIKEVLIPQFEKENEGVTVKYITGSSTDTLAKLKAQKNSPQIDVALLDDGPQAQARSFDLIASLNEDIVQNLNNVYEIAKFEDNLGVGFGVISTGLAYDKEKFEKNGWEPLKSWNDLADPKFKGQIVLPSIANTYGVHLLIMSAISNGGSIENIEPGFERLKEIADNAITFDTTADVSNFFLQGQAVASAWGSSRVYLLQDTGFPIEYVIPEEGAPALIATANVVKNAPNEELAQKFVDFLLGEEAQQLFAEHLSNAPVNKDVELDDSIVDKVQDIDKLIKIDWDLVNSKRAEWTERVSKEIEIAN
ncbi:ABC transporter substrate-binding protein [Sporosarcina sp. ACRSM]|uniref:ABC transporter substrate-binding protein n=1 Tax=Sporosarcina sp. ACRSM TaxID=2918216 RepID=UPI001EF68608|nr:ABC transporter substrate-binding protein [Sporosarcina sp. ACRSM]MCG7333719.1 ABC transporter substrate-binding protein [Sporosarcina sp. ACRSM]